MNLQNFFSQYQQFFLFLENEITQHDYLLFLIAAVITLSLLLIIVRSKNRLQQIRIKENQISATKSSYTITSQDIKAIAGEDLMATQLDLARAYIEMDKKSLAKKILEHVIEHGETTQQTAARELIRNL